jgi:hypothetical protein
MFYWQYFLFYCWYYMFYWWYFMYYWRYLMFYWRYSMFYWWYSYVLLLVFCPIHIVIISVLFPLIDIPCFTGGILSYPYCHYFCTVPFDWYSMFYWWYFGYPDFDVCTVSSNWYFMFYCWYFGYPDFDFCVVSSNWDSMFYWLYFFLSVLSLYLHCSLKVVFYVSSVQYSSI